MQTPADPTEMQKTPLYVSPTDFKFWLCGYYCVAVDQGLNLHEFTALTGYENVVLCNFWDILT